MNEKYISIVYHCPLCKRRAVRKYEIKDGMIEKKTMLCTNHNFPIECEINYDQFFNNLVEEKEQ